jgi:DNA-binding transcriptional MerR regulator
MGTVDELRIGEAAQQAGVSPRTLRYYEQLGLLEPSSRSRGGARRYGAADLERLARIRSLQELLGQDLDEIRAVLSAEDRLSELKDEWQHATAAGRRRILAEATAINADLRGQVRSRLTALQAFAGELEEKAARYRERAAELDEAEAATTAQARARRTRRK